MTPREPGQERIGYEVPDEQTARRLAAELDNRYSEEVLLGLRVYRIVWNGDFLVEATFSEAATEADRTFARALLGESGTPVHPDDLDDYRKAGTGGGIRGFFKRLFGG